MIIFAPAKLNIFLRVLGKKLDGYHYIRSGISFINLYDELTIKPSDRICIRYNGPFQPQSSTYNDCIILKLLNFWV